MTAAVLLLTLGLGLIVAEIFIPSFGVLSVLATAAIVAAVAMAFRESSALGVRFLIATAALVPVTIVLGFKFFPRSPLGKRMVVRPSLEGAEALAQRRALLEKQGTVEAVCRPAGMARIDGQRIDVVARGEWLEEGARVRVVEVHGNRVVVARAEEHGTNGPEA